MEKRGIGNQAARQTAHFPSVLPEELPRAIDVWPELPEAVRHGLARWRELPEAMRAGIVALFEAAIA